MVTFNRIYFNKMCWVAEFNQPLDKPFCLNESSLRLRISNRKELKLDTQQEEMALSALLRVQGVMEASL